MKTISVTFAWCHDIFEFESEIVEETHIQGDIWFQVIPRSFIRCRIWDGNDHSQDAFFSEIAELPEQIQKEIRAILGHEIRVPDAAKYGAWIYIKNPLED